MQLPLKDFEFDAERSLKAVPTVWQPTRLDKASVRAWAKSNLDQTGAQLNEAQLRLYAHRDQSLLVILQGMDTSGKDGLIRHVFTHVNPVGLQVKSFIAPTPVEKLHGFLWRAIRALPDPGHIGVFNRSYYEEVMYLKVHPELRNETADGNPWSEDELFADILQFEQALTRRGTRLLKIFLHISPAEQRRRLLRRAENPDRCWKLQDADLQDRRLWDEHYYAFEAALQRTSTLAAPWYVVPSDEKVTARCLVAALVLNELMEMAPRFPEPTAEKRALCATVLQALSEESC